MQKVDLIIIGSGPGGYEVAAEAAARGVSVVLFEKDKLGGTCLNRGCIPTKCLCASAERIEEVRSASAFGIEVSHVGFDYAKIHERTESVVSQLREDIGGSLSKVTLVHGEASLGRDRTVFFAGESYTADKIVIATGSRPALLPIPGSEYTLSSDEVLAMTSLPERIAIIGGGVIGLEFASIFVSFGVDVTVIEYCKEVLPGFDRDIAKRLRSYLSRRGIKFICGAKVISVSSDNTVEYEAKNKTQSLNVDKIISAVGRKAVLPQGCEEAGIMTNNRGFIEVDEKFRTNIEGIYAVGDVNGKCMLAHAATAQSRSVVFDLPYDQAVPGVVFTLPECASVGLTTEKVPEGIEAGEVKLPYSSNGKACASGASDGLLKLVFNTGDGKILGCHVVGTHAADIVAEISVAMMAGCTVREIGLRLIHAHPSISELIGVACRMASETLA